jgi:hypothetical protein
MTTALKLQKPTIKERTIEIVQKVLRSHRKYYISSDFPFLQILNFYITYQGKIMNDYLRQKGYLIVKAKEIDIQRIDGRKVRKNRNVYITANNYIQYALQTIDIV